MRTSIAVGLLLGLFGTVPLAKAQEEPPTVELYGGYYYARFNINANLPGVRTLRNFQRKRRRRPV
jgi:hypothetical protein